MFHASDRGECGLLTCNVMKFLAYCRNIKLIYIEHLYTVHTGRYVFQSVLNKIWRHKIRLVKVLNEDMTHIMAAPAFAQVHRHLNRVSYSFSRLVMSYMKRPVYKLMIFRILRNTLRTFFTFHTSGKWLLGCALLRRTT